MPLMVLSVRATLRLVYIQMGHENVDNHNLSKHITDHIFLGTKILIRFYHKLFCNQFWTMY